MISLRPPEAPARAISSGRYISNPCASYNLFSVVKATVFPSLLEVAVTALHSLFNEQDSDVTSFLFLYYSLPAVCHLIKTDRLDH